MHKQPQKPAPPAFTLAEIVIVITVISLLAAAATVSFSSAATHTQLNAAADNLTANLRLAQQHARQNRQSVTVQFDANTLSYSIPGILSLTHAPNVNVNLTLAPYCLSHLTIMNVSKGDNEEHYTLEFDTQGRASANLAITLARGSSSITLYVYENGGIERAD